MKNVIRKMTSSLRGRLTLWYFFSVGVFSLIVMGAMAFFIKFTLLDQIDHHVHIAVTEAKQITENYQGLEREDLIKNLVNGQGMTVVILSPDGAPILETNSPDTALATEHELQKIMLTQTLAESTPTHFTESDVRFAVMPAQVKAGKGVVAVGYSTKVIYAAFYNMILIVIAGLIFIVTPISLLGYKLLKNHLAPLEMISAQAESISSRNLSHRIHTKSSTEELISIENALNQMLTKLERVFDGEREFFSDAAHTLKTPLARLRAQVETSSLSTTKKDELFATIDEASNTIQDLLYLSKLGRIETEWKEVDLSKIVKNLTELATTLATTQNVLVKSDIISDVQIQGDKKLLERALGNIIQNAVLYNHNNGTVDINLSQHQDNIKLSVSDTGIGIYQDDMPKIFNRFFRGRNTNVKGSGLGLAISKAIIETMGGTIKLESKRNSGTTVTVIF